MTLAAAWPEALIAALAALGGAIVGAGASIWATLHAERSNREQERRDALVAFFGSAMAFATFASGWAEMQLKGPFADIRLGIRMAGLTGVLVSRLWNVSDTFWQASTHARAVATREELAAIDAVETAIGNWKFGEPITDEFATAIRQFRVLLSRRDGDDESAADSPGDSSGDTQP